MIAYSYLRVSSRGQVEGDGFQRQAEAINLFVDRLGARHVAMFLEAGVTGVVSERPALSDLLVMVSVPSDEPAVVVVESADRLARDSFISEVIIRDFAAVGVRILTSSGVDLTDSDDPSRNLIRQVLSAVAEYDKRALVAKLRSARERARARTGRCEGAKPFGWFQHERRALDEILGLWSWGWSYERIAKHMNQMALKDRDMLPRRGGKWYKGVVHAIVRANRERSSHDKLVRDSIQG